MSSPQNQNSQPFLAPRRIVGVNRIGLLTFIGKEVSRFANIYVQTLLAPVITTILFFLIFALALGQHNEAVEGVPYLEFLVPGLVMMAMVQNAFANTSSSILISKVQGNIVDVLMPPLSPGELLVGYTLGGVIRGLAVGIACVLSLRLFVPFGIHSPSIFILSAVLSTLMLSLIGVAGGLWSEKFDHMATITNFVVTPLAFLSGTFYSTQKLPEIWHGIAMANPFFHMIDSFRYSMIGYADADIASGLIWLAIVNALLLGLCYRMFRTGYKIRA
ncbi:MAG: ABC transporter permease [Micavibrio sp.]